jgi:hypothetical protein
MWVKNEIFPKRSPFEFFESHVTNVEIDLFGIDILVKGRRK